MKLIGRILSPWGFELVGGLCLLAASYEFLGSWASPEQFRLAMNLMGYGSALILAAYVERGMLKGVQSRPCETKKGEPCDKSKNFGP